MKKILLIIGLCIILSNFVLASDATNLKERSVAYWKLETLSEEVQGLTLNNNGATSGETGIIDNAYSFDGGTDRMHVDPSNIFSLNNYSINIWVNMSTNTQFQFPLDYIYYNGVTYYGWYVLFRDDGSIEFKNYIGSGGTSVGARSSASTYTTNNWDMYTFTYDGTNSNIYKNGVETSYITDTTGSVAYSTDDHYLQFGIYSIDNTTYPLDGVLDEMSFYNDTLNQTEINYLYNSGSPNATQQYPFEFINVTTLEITLDYPKNGTHYNLINPAEPSKVFNGSIVTSTNKDATCTNEVLPKTPPFKAKQFFNNVTVNSTTQVYTNFTTLVEQNYSMEIECTDGYNTTSINFWFIIDQTNVTANINVINNSIQANEFNLKVDYFDLYLYRTNTTVIRTSDNFTLYNNDSGILGYETEYYNVTYPINLLNTTYNVGEIIKVIVNGADTHTASKFKERPEKTKVTIFDKNIKEYKLDHGKFRLEYPKDYEINEDYSFDRMHFKIKKNTERDISKKKAFIAETSYQYVEADKIVYYPESEYPCHMIVNDKYWYDCVGMTNQIVKKEYNNRYRIDYIKDKEEIITK